MTGLPQGRGVHVADAAAWSRRGLDHYARGELNSARRALEFAVKIEPHEPTHLLTLGRLLLETQDVRALKDVIERVRERCSNVAETHLLDGHLQRILGKTDLAIGCFRRALNLDPACSNALFNLADLRPDLRAGDEMTAQLENLRTHTGRLEDRANVCFALARIYDTAGEFDRAFSCYEQANAATAAYMAIKEVIYEPGAVERMAAQAIAAQKVIGCASLLEPIDLDLRMIFIVGLPRSGTTLVEQILSCHDRVDAGGELPLMQDCVREFEKRGGDYTDVALLADIRELYLDGIFSRDLDGQYVTDKLPGNFQWIGLIRRLFPDCTIVHCQRHPTAVCWSLFTSNFTRHEPYCNSFEHLVHYHGIYQRLMRHWREIAAPPLLEIRYEELVYDTEREVRRLLAGCGLEWQPRCVEFHSFERPIHTASQMQVRRPIYSSSVDKWRRYEKRLAPLIDRLGATR